MKNRVTKCLVLSALAIGISSTVMAEEQVDACKGRIDSVNQLVNCIHKEALWKHMVKFQEIGDANPGPDGYASRNTGEPGYLASVNYVVKMMKKAGYLVKIQTYSFLYGAYTATPTFSEMSPSFKNYILAQDFYPAAAASLTSGKSNAIAQIQNVGGIIIPATDTPSSSSGCATTDFSGFKVGNIALIQRGTCEYTVKVQNAEAAGAAGVIIFNEGNPGRTNAGFSCRLGVVASVPVICLASYAVGADLYNHVLNGATSASLDIPVIVETRPDYNVIADSRYGDPNKIVVVDSHLDAIYGNGMLDSASGSATILEVALKLKDTPTRSKLRYIWFGGEELGLLGSQYYTKNLSTNELNKLIFDIDADVTATQNYNIEIADPANSSEAASFPSNVVPLSQIGNHYFYEFFNSKGIPSRAVSFGNDGTDSYSFSLMGVPNTGILTRQGCCKTDQDVLLWGGFPGNFEGNISRGIPFDIYPFNNDGGCVDMPYIHCDNLDNNDPNVLALTSKAVAYVTYKIANDKSLNSTVKDNHNHDQDHNKIM